MYDALKALRPDWHAKEETKGGMKVVMTGSASDPADIQAHIRTKVQNEAIANRFKDENDPQTKNLLSVAGDRLQRFFILKISV